MVDEKTSCTTRGTRNSLIIVLKLCFPGTRKLVQDFFHQQYHLQQKTLSELWGYPSVLAGRLRLLQSQKLWRISFSWASVDNHKESWSNESKKMVSDNDLDKMHFCETCTWKESHLFDLSRPTFDPHPTWMGLRTRDFPPWAPSFKGLSPNHGRSSKSSKFGSPHIRKKSWKKGLDFWRRNSGGGPSNLKHLQY